MTSIGISMSIRTETKSFLAPIKREMRNKIIIIPDVHGRTFWIDAVWGHENDDIIFLGDYLDPYTSIEGITREQAMKNFMNILSFKDEHPNNVTLLLGNHDLGYICESVCQSRRDWEHYNEIADVFEKNIGKFILATERTSQSGRRILFTHAGVQKGWLLDKLRKDDIATAFPDLVERHGKGRKTIIAIHPELFTAETLNGAWKAKEADPERYETLMTVLGMVPYSRGGWYNHGSPIWGDANEMSNYDETEPLCYLEDGKLVHWFQVFGHTWIKEPYITDNIACLDTGNAYTLSNQNIFYEADGTPITPIPSNKNNK
jgi:hypothetical protein